MLLNLTVAGGFASLSALTTIKQIRRLTDKVSAADARTGQESINLYSNLMLVK